MRCSNCNAEMDLTDHGYVCGYCGNIGDEGGFKEEYRGGCRDEYEEKYRREYLDQNMTVWIPLEWRRRHSCRYYLLFTSNISILLGLLFPWYQTRGICKVLLWEVETVTDNMGLLHSMHDACSGWCYLWFILFMACIIASTVTLGISDFRKAPIILAVLMILLGIAWNTAPPDPYIKAGSGQFFMIAGFAGYVLTLLAEIVKAVRFYAII